MAEKKRNKVKKSYSFVMMSPKTNQIEQIDMNKSHEVLNGKTTSSLLTPFNRKRRHTFDVDLNVERVLSLPYASGKFFFKIRLLNGGNHIYTCNERFEVHENKVEFNLCDSFQVKMTSRVDNFTLDHCLCRISIRKEGRGGRSYEKIGFYDLDLAPVAGTGDQSKSCLLNGYQHNNSSPANAYLQIRMNVSVVEGDHIFRRPDSDHPYIKVEPGTLTKKTHDPCSDDGCSTVSASAGELYPPLTTNPIRGHSRQESKSSMCSNYSSNSINSTNNSIPHDKNPLRHVLYESRPFHNSHSDPNMLANVRQGSDEESSQQPQRRVNHKRRTPFIDQFGDIQRRLHSTRIDATEIVDSVMSNNAKTVTNSNGYLCLTYDKDGTARVGSSSCQSFQSPPLST